MTSQKTHNRHAIGVLMGDRSNAFWSDMDRHYTAFAPQYGIDISSVYGLPEKDPAAQAAAFDRLIAEGRDGIIINPITNDNLVDGIRRARSLSIPVFDVGAKTDQSLVRGMETTYFPVRTVDFHQQGRLGGGHLAACLGRGNGGKIAIIRGRLRSAQSIGRSAGAIEALAGTPGIEVIEPEPADFDPEKALRIARILLEATPDIRGFFCANDQMALAVATAVDEVEADRDCLIVGVDGIAEARRAVQDGRMSATVAFETSDVAHVILNKVRAVLSDQPLSQEKSVASRLLTKADFSQAGE